MGYTDGEEYVDRRPPDNVCTWCGREWCGQCAVWKRKEPEP